MGGRNDRVEGNMDSLSHGLHSQIISNFPQNQTEQTLFFFKMSHKINTLST